MCCFGFVCSSRVSCNTSGYAGHNGGVSTDRGLSADKPETSTPLGDDARELFAVCYQRFYSDVVRYARRRVGPEMAGDVAAEVFVVAWRRVNDLTSADNQLAWLYGVARLTVANAMRSERRRSALQQRAAGETRPEEAREPYGSAETLAALRRLAPKDQEVLRLVAWEGLKGEDLAVALGTSKVAARSRLHRARRRFERALGAQRALTTKGERHA